MDKEKLLLPGQQFTFSISLVFIMLMPELLSVFSMIYSSVSDCLLSIFSIRFENSNFSLSQIPPKTLDRRCKYIFLDAICSLQDVACSSRKLLQLKQHVATICLQ